MDNKNDRKVLLKNTLMLYIMRFSSYFFSFISVPYQTRVLGTIPYGAIGIASAFMMYFQLFLDYGFILSATEDVSKRRGNLREISRIYSSVTYIKIVFSIVSVITMYFICLNFKQYSDLKLYFWFLVGTIVNAFFPDFLYRGLEDMSPLTYRSVATKAFSTILIFVFLKEPSDYLVVPILTALGNIAGLLWTFYDAKKRFGVSFIEPELSHIFISLKSSSTFFLSRIATTVFTATNTIILGLIDPVGVTVGLYTSAYKLVSTGQSALSPIADSVYPYMIRNKDFKLIKKMLLIFMPIISIASVGIFIFSDSICALFFGNEFREAGTILRAMLPLALTTLPEYLFGFPSLSAINKTKFANYSIYFSTVVHLIIMVVLLVTHQLTAVKLALLLSLASFNNTIFRLISIIYFKNKTTKEEKI